VERRLSLTKLFISSSPTIPRRAGISERCFLHGNVYLESMEYRRSGRRRAREVWDAARLQALRRHLRMTQQQLADELGMRQQTVSEWETGVYRPRGASVRLLSVIAESSGFTYAGAPSKRP
jgi:DNA-binding transcriptional regulator YiaG